MNILSRLLLCFAIVTMAISGCAAGDSGEPRPRGEEPGSIGLELVVGPYTINTVHYDIVGTNGFHAEGDINVSMSSAISGFVGSIPASGGYTITLTATSSSHPNVGCTGVATFAVMAGATTVVNVALTCRNTNNNGGIIINGTINLCPSINVFDAAPLSAAVGTSIALHAAATDIDNLPTPLTYNWSAPGFTASNANASFPCIAAGNYPLTLVVSDGDTSCDASGTVMLSCY
jgi:hypothetical protein